MKFITVQLVVWLALTGVARKTRESEVVGPHEPVRAKVGEDVLLPCYVDPPLDVRTLTVEWKWNQTLVVHMYKNRGDNSDSQNEKFKSRTFLFHDEMSEGNISLKLTKIIDTDGGSYTCSVRKLHDKVKTSNVTLIVDPAGEGKEIRKGGEPTIQPEPEDFNRIPVYIGVGVFVVLAVAVSLFSKYRKQCTCSGQNRRERPEDHQESNQEEYSLRDMEITDNMDNADRQSRLSTPDTGPSTQTHNPKLPLNQRDE